MGKRIVFILAVAIQLLILSFYWYEIDLQNLIFGQSIKNKASPKPKASTKKHDNFANNKQHRQRGKLKLGKELLLHLSSKTGQTGTGMKETATESSDKPLQAKMMKFASSNGIKTKTTEINYLQMHRDFITSKVENHDSLFNSLHKTESYMIEEVLHKIKDRDSLTTALPTTLTAKLYSTDDNASFVHDKQSTESDKQQALTFPQAITQTVSYDKDRNDKNKMIITAAYLTQEVVRPTSVNAIRKTRAYHTEKRAPTAGSRNKETITYFPKKNNEASQNKRMVTLASRTQEVVSATSLTLINKTRAYHTEKVTPVSKITTRDKIADRSKEANPTHLTLIRKTRAYQTETITPFSEIATREKMAYRSQETSPTHLTLIRKTRGYHTEKASPISQMATREQNVFRTKKVNAVTTQATTRAEATTILEKPTLHAKNNGFHSDPNMLFGDEYEKAKEMKTVDLLIIVLTAPSNTRRRDIIRQTWWRNCIANEKVSCWFFTDKLESIDNSETRKRILLERNRHHDMIFSPVGRGIQFGFRFLHLIQWGKANYDFKYIMRIDDDIMLCLDHLLWDLPNFPLQGVHYGWMHCQGQNLVYIDEGVSMFSKDVVEKFLSQNPDQIMCHPFGDQQVAVWEQALNMSPSVYYMPDNNRIHHHPPASYDDNVKQKRDLCDNYIAIHGVYKNDMLEFWKRRGRGTYRKYSRKSTGYFCPHYPNVNINLFGGMYHHEPKPCSSKPHWNLDTYKKYPGRER